MWLVSPWDHLPVFFSLALVYGFRPLCLAFYMHAEAGIQIFMLILSANTLPAEPTPQPPRCHFGL